MLREAHTLYLVVNKTQGISPGILSTKHRESTLEYCKQNTGNQCRNIVNKTQGISPEIFVGNSMLYLVVDKTQGISPEILLTKHRESVQKYCQKHRESVQSPAILSTKHRESVQKYC